MVAGTAVDSSVEWADPPPDNRGRPKNHKEIAAQLKANPGVWAKVAAYSKAPSSATTAHIIRTARFKSYEPAGSYDAVARTVDGVHWVFARYVGEK